MDPFADLPMISELIDISVPVAPAMHTMPGNEATVLHAGKRLARGDIANLSSLTISLHAGTHIDAPRHMFEGADDIAALPLRRVVGPAWVAAVPDIAIVTRADLEAAAIPNGVKRLLLKTANSRRWADAQPNLAYVGVENDGAEWLVEHGMEVVGIDYLGIEPPGRNPPTTHHILMRGGVTIIEGVDLSRVGPGPYLLLCLPLPIVDGDGSPVRIVLAR
jgi:arylformamidase